MAESGSKKNIGTYVFTLLLSVVVVATLLFTLLPIRKSETEKEPVFSGWIYHREDQKTANGALARAGLADYRWSQGQLSVPSRERARYESVLAESKAFPKAPGDMKRDALREMSQFEPIAKMRLRDLYSAGWQLEQTIEHFSTQVSYATVGVRSRPEQTGMIQKNVVTASVGIWPRDDTPLSAELLSAITLATKHHLGITENENISILDLRRGCSYLGTDAGVSTPLSTQARQEHLRKEYWNEKLLVAFRHIPGLKVSTSIIRPVAKTIPTLNLPKKEEEPPMMEEPPKRTTFAILGNRVPATYVSRPVTSEVQAVHASIDRPSPPELPQTANDIVQTEEGAEISVEIGIPETYIHELVRHSIPDRKESRKVDFNVLLAQKGKEVTDQVKKETIGLLREVFVTEGSSPARDKTLVQVSIIPEQATQMAPNSTVLEKPVMIAESKSQAEFSGPSAHIAQTHPVNLEARMLEIWQSNRHSPIFWISSVGALLIFVTVVVACVSFLLRKIRALFRREVSQERTETPLIITNADTIEDTLEIRCDHPVEEPLGRNVEEATRVINQWLRAS